VGECDILLRSWDSIKESGGAMSKHIAIYKQAFKALKSLNSTGLLQHISKDDLRLNADVTEENRFNQSKDKMSWIWTIGTSQEECSSEMMKESMFNHSN
jgi:hypothetical protein